MSLSSPVDSSYCWGFDVSKETAQLSPASMPPRPVLLLTHRANTLPRPTPELRHVLAPDVVVAPDEPDEGPESPVIRGLKCSF